MKTTVVPQSRNLSPSPMRMALDKNGFLVPVMAGGQQAGQGGSEERLLKKAEAARLLSVSMATINRMLKAETLPRRQINGSVRIPLSAVNQIMEGC